MVLSLVADLRFALRSLAHRPGLTLAVALVLTLGIGTSVTIFTVVDAVLLRPLGYPEPERIVRLLGTQEGADEQAGTIAWLDFRDFRRRSGSFSAIAAYDEWTPTLSGGDRPERIDAALVDAEFFSVLGVDPALGRFFRPEEDVDGQDRVVVLSHGLWQRRFGGDREVIGREVLVDARSHTVVGVAPEAFEDPRLSGMRWPAPEMWRPLGFEGLSADRLPNRGSASYTAIGRLAPGVTREAAEAELSAIARDLRREYPETHAGRGVRLVRLSEDLLAPVRRTLALLFGAVLFLLLIAAANAANLLLIRGTERQAEAALRVALGASRSRIARSLAMESVLLALLGGALGLLLALYATPALLSLAGDALPRAGLVAVDLRAVAFAAGLSLVLGLPCGLAPALFLVRRDAPGLLRDGRSDAAAGARGARLRDGLVVAQVAVSLTLLVGAGLLGESYRRLSRVDPGIDPAGVLTFELHLPGSTYPETADVDEFHRRLLSRLGALPEVEGVASVNILPLAGNFDCNPVVAAERPATPLDEAPCAESRTTTPGYVRVMGLELLAGRPLAEADRADARPVAVISDSLARSLWPGADAVGRRVLAFGLDREIEVVGVVADVKHAALDQPAPPRIYLAWNQGVVPYQKRRVVVVARTAGDPLTIVPQVRREVSRLDPGLPLSAVRSMEQVMAASTARPRLRTVLLAVFAVAALLLATVGIYGSLAYAVAQRRFELAVRLALGACRRELQGLVVRRGIGLIAAGAAVGLPAAWLLGRSLRGLLYGIEPADPWAFLGVTFLMLATGALASWLPARRASRTDPVAALRA